VERLASSDFLQMAEVNVDFGAVGFKSNSERCALFFSKSAAYALE